MLRLWSYGAKWDCDVIADDVWCECTVLIGSDIYAWNARFDSGFICFIFLIILHSMWKKRLRMVACAWWGAETFRDVPWLRPCTRLRFEQGLRPRYNPACLWSPKCMGNHSSPLYWGLVHSGICEICLLWYHYHYLLSYSFLPSGSHVTHFVGVNI